MASSNGHLKVVAVDEDRAALDRAATLLEGMGHDVAACAVSVREACEAVAREDPDLAVVKVHEDQEHALELIEEIVSFARGPVVALVGEHDPEFVAKAATRGIHAYACDDSEGAVRSAIALALRRHADEQGLEQQVAQLQTALERRALIERAKGILMERHGVGERDAFEALRSHARAGRRTVVDVASSVLDGHVLPNRDGRPGLAAAAAREPSAQD